MRAGGWHRCAGPDGSSVQSYDACGVALPMNTEARQDHQLRLMLYYKRRMLGPTRPMSARRILCAITDRSSDEVIFGMSVSSMCWFEAGFRSIR
jgi:hypothetical protein